MHIYAKRNNLLFRLVSSFWIYGNWKDYFNCIPDCDHVDVKDYTTLQRLLSEENGNVPCWLFSAPYNRDLANKLADVLCGQLSVSYDEKKTTAEQIIQYSDTCQRDVQTKIDSLGLPELYCAISVRRGDKITEAKYYSIDEYLSRITRKYSDIFIMTDDYDVIREYTHSMKKYHLVEPSEKGFYLNYTKHSDQKGSYTFNTLSHEEKYRHVIKLLAQQDICAKSDTFVSTFSTNVARFIYLKSHHIENVHSLDWERWTPY